MKFSYKYLKNFVADMPSCQELAEKLAFHLFEVESNNGDIFDIKILPNRYSDAACYLGLAREIAAICNKTLKEPLVRNLKAEIKKTAPVAIKSKFCRRLSARYFEGIKIGPSPKWLVEALAASGLRSINNLVDITNYVTLETGQPLHAFDFEKMTGWQLIVRAGQAGEIVETLDGVKVELDSDIMVLADKKDPLDIAGIKGGKKAEITSATKNILLTAGNFDGVTIYKTSRKIALTTDASIRFSHNLSPELVGSGLARATQLIKELCGGQVGPLTDVYPNKPSKIVIRFDIEKFNALTGVNLKENQAINHLKKLNFSVKNNLVEVPAIRTDVETPEDLTEEIMRLYGYENIKPIPPHVTLSSPGFEDQIVLKDKIKNILINLGLNEIYNYSFIGGGDLKLENPTSSETSFLRHSLSSGLLTTITNNLRFFDRVPIFEIGRVFTYPDKETEFLGLAIGDQKHNCFFEVRGAVDSLLEKLGLTDYFMREEASDRLRLEANHHVLGYLSHQDGGRLAIAEINLEKLLRLVTEEKEYEPLSKFPSISRDISVLASREIRVNQIMELIEAAAFKYLDDVDLIDTYEDPKLMGQESLTFRLVFLAENKTLTDKEIDDEMAKVTKALTEKLGVEIR